MAETRLTTAAPEYIIVQKYQESFEYTYLERLYNHAYVLTA